MGKIEDLGLIDEVIDLTSKGMSPRGISKHFKEHGIAISYQTIRRFVKTIPELMERMVQKNDALKQTIVGSVLDSTERISFIATQAATIYKEARDKQDLNVALRALNTIGDACVLKHKLLGATDEITDIVQLIQKLDPESEYRKALENVYNRRANG